MHFIKTTDEKIFGGLAHAIQAEALSEHILFCLYSNRVQMST